MNLTIYINKTYSNSEITQWYETMACTEKLNTEIVWILFRSSSRSMEQVTIIVKVMRATCVNLFTICLNKYFKVRVIVYNYIHLTVFTTRRCSYPDCFLSCTISSLLLKRVTVPIVMYLFLTSTQERNYSAPHRSNFLVTLNTLTV